MEMDDSFVWKWMTQGTITLQSENTEEIMKMLDQARKDLKAAESEKSKLLAQKAAADRQLKQDKAAEQANQEAEEAALIEKHRKSAEAEAKKKREEERRAAEAFQKQQETDAAAKEAEHEELYASRADVMREQKEKEELRKAKAAKLESSEAAVKKTQVKDKYAGLFGAKKYVPVCITHARAHTYTHTHARALSLFLSRIWTHNKTTTTKRCCTALLTGRKRSGATENPKSGSRSTRNLLHFRLRKTSGMRRTTG